MKFINGVVVLSRRNLLALLAKLEENRVSQSSKSACMIHKNCEITGDTGIEGTKHIFVRAEEDDVHYQDKTPGPMKPLTEIGIEVLSHKIGGPHKVDLKSNSFKD